MSVEVALPDYSPPPIDDCEEDEYQHYLTDDDRVTVKTIEYRRRLVDFALIQCTREANVWHEVCRFDCRHSSVHKHQLYLNGRAEHRTDLLKIPGISGPESWDVVHTGYEMSYPMMFDGWEASLREWRTA